MFFVDKKKAGLGSRGELKRMSKTEIPAVMVPQKSEADLQWEQIEKNLKY